MLNTTIRDGSKKFSFQEKVFRTSGMGAWVSAPEACMRGSNYKERDP